MADPERRVTRASSKSRSAPRPRRSMSADSKRERHPAEDVGLPHSREPSLGAAGSKTPSDRASAQPAERERQEVSTDGGSSNKGKTGKRSKSAGALSCSELGAKPLYGISPAAKLSFSSYAHDRKIISLTNVKLKTDVKKEDKAPDTKESGPDKLDIITSEIDEMLQFYDEMTRYLKPPIAEHGLPAVDKRVEVVREHFLGQTSEYSNGSNTPELSQEFWEIISGCFSSLLWASVSGYSKERGGKSINEAEARHEWDILLNFGFVNTGELASGRVVLERALSLSRDIAADLAKASTRLNGEVFEDVADQAYQISLQVQQALNRRPSSSRAATNLLLQATDAVGVALRNKVAVSELFENARAAKNAILKHADAEPELGIVDAVLTIPLEHGQKNPESLVRITESRETVQAARTLNADYIAELDNKSMSEKRPSKSNNHTKSPGHPELGQQ